MKHGRKYVEAAKLVDRATLYDPADAIALVKKTATAKFDDRGDDGIDGSSFFHRNTGTSGTEITAEPGASVVRRFRTCGGRFCR